MRVKEISFAVNKQFNVKQATVIFNIKINIRQYTCYIHAGLNPGVCWRSALEIW